MSAHTPGNWVVKPDDYSRAIHIQAPGPVGICHLSGIAAASEHAQANARLIAAAPDLLAALIDLVHLVPEVEQQDNAFMAFQAARAAIDKATLATTQILSTSQR